MENKITHEGVLSLGEFNIPCYVLENGTRILSTSAMQRALGVVSDEKERSATRLGIFLTSKAVSPFVSDDLISAKLSTIICYKGKQKITGYEATVLPELCEIMLKVRDYSIENSIELGLRQKAVVLQADILMRSLAKVGIISLIDEATGYQYDREKNELQKILKAYIAEELLPWEKRFPDEFYKEIFRLNKWDFTVNGIKERPSVIGTWTKKYIYNVLPSGVLSALLEKTERNDKGSLKHRLHQHLTKEQGIEHLNKQIISTVTLMNVSDNWTSFDKIWNKKFGQQELSFEELGNIDPK